MTTPFQRTEQRSTMRRPMKTSAGLALALAAACGDPTGPPGRNPNLLGCEAGATPIAFAVGEVRSGIDASGMCVTATEAADYAIIAFHEASASSARADITVTGSGTTTPGSVPNPSLAPTEDELVDDLPLDAGFEFRLRERERKLGALIGGAQVVPGASPSPGSGALRAAIPSSVTVGQLLTLNVNYDDNCSNPQDRIGRVAAITAKAIIVADEANPSGGFTDAEYQSIGVTFDTLVHPLVVENFGEPGDLDANGRILIFFTKSVNELTPRASTTLVGGFFFGRDLFPIVGNTQVQGCATSNVGEMFYMLVPDPTGVVNGNIRTKVSVQRQTIGVLAHEYQHLVNASRRLYITRAPAFEETWLNEGFSHIAEELLFYRVTRLTPRMNLASADFNANVPDRETAFNEYQIANFGRLRRYLQVPSGNSPYSTEDSLASRGAIWSFLRYAADQRGGSETALWNAMVRDAKAVGFANLRAGLGSEPLPWFRDWSTSLYADDAVAGIPIRYQQPSWNYRSMYTRLPPSTRLPLEVKTLGNSSQTISIVGGGSAYWKTGVPANGRAQLSWSGPAAVKVTVVRVR